MSIFTPPSSGTVTLTELRPTLGGQPRPPQVVFEGPDRPANREGWPWIGGTVRGITVWYPGSPFPTNQILGPEDHEIVFSGKFEDRKKGIVGWAQQMAGNLDQMRRRSYPVRFDFMGFSYVCRWVEFKFQPEERARISYVVRLTIVDSEIGGRQRVFQGIRSIPMVDDILAAAQTVQGIVATIPGAAGGAALVNVTKFTSALTAGVSGADGALRTMQTNGVDPKNANTALSNVDQATASAKAAWDSLNQISWTNIPGPLFDALRTGAQPVLAATTAVVGVAQSLGAIRPAVANLVQLPLGAYVYVAANGETLMSIAQKIYGSFQRWVDIARQNNLTTPAVKGGQQLVIPNAPQQDQQASSTAVTTP